MTVATNRPDGWPQATIVGYVNDGLAIYCFVGRAGQKFTNISRDSRVSLAIGNDYPQPLQIKGLSIGGRAAETTDPAELKRVMELMLKRYPEYAAMPMPGPEVIAVLRITPEIVSILDYSKGFAHTDLVAVGETDLPKHLGSSRHTWLAPRAA